MTEPIEAPGLAEAELRAARKLAKRAELEALAVEDPDGAEWHGKARAKWAAAVDLATIVGGEPLDYYEPEPLPDFASRRPAHVKRELLGRFIVDRDTLVVHDVYSAKPECGIDTIANATFVHFLSELVETAEEETPCSACLGA